jgi:adenylate cyclase
LEVERKFLVDELPGGLDRDPGVEIVQGYLSIDGVTEVRVRRKGDRCTLTVKQGSGLARSEFEIGIEKEQFDVLWPATAGRRIEKTRYELPLGMVTAELDRYHGVLDGLTTVEVEFGSVPEARAFVPPSWFDRELTDDGRFANRNLAVDGRPTPG